MMVQTNMTRDFFQILHMDLLASTLVILHKVTNRMAIHHRATLQHLVVILNKDTLHRDIPHRGGMPHKDTHLQDIPLTPKGMDLMEDHC